MHYTSVSTFSLTTGICIIIIAPFTRGFNLGRIRVESGSGSCPNEKIVSGLECMGVNDRRARKRVETPLVLRKTRLVQDKETETA